MIVSIVSTSSSSRTKPVWNQDFALYCFSRNRSTFFLLYALLCFIWSFDHETDWTKICCVIAAQATPVTYLGKNKRPLTLVVSQWTCIATCWRESWALIATNLLQTSSLPSSAKLKMLSMAIYSDSFQGQIEVRQRVWGLLENLHLSRIAKYWQTFLLSDCEWDGEKWDEMVGDARKWWGCSGIVGRRRRKGEEGAASNLSQ